MLTTGLTSSGNDMWATPRDLFDKINSEFQLDIDVCATPENAKLKNFFSPADDGLKQNWGATGYGAILLTAGRLASGLRRLTSRTRKLL